MQFALFSRVRPSFAKVQNMDSVSLTVPLCQTVNQAHTLADTFTHLPLLPVSCCVSLHTCKTGQRFQVVGSSVGNCRSWSDFDSRNDGTDGRDKDKEKEERRARIFGSFPASSRHHLQPLTPSLSFHSNTNCPSPHRNILSSRQIPPFLMVRIWRTRTISRHRDVFFFLLI